MVVESRQSARNATLLHVVLALKHDKRNYLLNSDCFREATFLLNSTLAAYRASIQSMVEFTETEFGKLPSQEGQTRPCLLSRHASDTQHTYHQAVACLACSEQTATMY